MQESTHEWMEKIEVRYPGVTADAEDAQEALQTAQAVRDLVRQALGLD